MAVFRSGLLGLALTLTCQPAILAKGIDRSRLVTNPVNICYQFFDDKNVPSHRTAADLVVVYYRDKYYMFGSHSEGYHSSPDLKNWTYIKSKMPAVKVWAPAVMVYEDAIYYLGMGQNKIYKTTNPDADEWTEIDSRLTPTTGYGDPSFFADDDGKVYLVWGCSSGSPVKIVEVNPKEGFKVVGRETDLLFHNPKEHGWEVPGDNNEKTEGDTWNEGPCLIKVDGKYYLQYATPGTEFTSYSTGVYVADNVKGPYVCADSNPYATKHTGFVRGAGHGHTFTDKYGNYWFVGTMIVSVREHFERRVGIFPAYFDKGHAHVNTVFSDYPFVIPDRKVDFKTTDISARMNLLSYGKAVKASSSKQGFAPEKAADENIRTWWAAETGQAGEWLEMDLGRPMTLEAIQMNFADEGFRLYRGEAIPIYKYVVEYSTDGRSWKMWTDQSGNKENHIHELIVPDKPVKGRYVRVTNKGGLPGQFSIYDLRIFGKAKGSVPHKVTGFKAERNQADRRRYNLSWNKTDGADGYVIHWGTERNRLDNAAVIRGESADLGLFNSKLDYYFTIEAFNESGRGSKTAPIK